MKISPLIFRNYDIRGVVDVDLDKLKVEALGKAYGTFLVRRKIGQMVCGRDCRLSGPKFQKAFMNGVLSTGVDIIDLGLIMTQMMYFGQYRFQTNGGAILTASHNPKNFNGFKLGVGYSQTTGPEDVQELRRYVENDEYFIAAERGKISKAAIKEDYILDVLKRVRLKRSFRVVVDSHCGTTGIYVPEILRRAGCEVVEMNTKVDGSFPKGTPDPTDGHLMEALAQVVLSKRADLGIAFDGDGDRVFFFDEKGSVLSSYESFRCIKGGFNPPYVLDSRALAEFTMPNEQVVQTKVGYYFIRKAMEEHNAELGAEYTGHFYFKNFFYHILECPRIF